MVAQRNANAQPGAPETRNRTERSRVAWRHACGLLGAMPWRLGHRPIAHGIVIGDGPHHRTSTCEL
eukprot:4170833-Prymnesium_polylepis.1